MDDHSAFPPLSHGQAPPSARLTAHQKSELARRAEIFSETTVERLFQFAEIAHEVDFANGQVIFQEGSVSEAFYVIVQGEVELASPEKAGRKVVGAGHAFGLYGVLAAEPRSVTATARLETFVIAIEAEDFYTLLSNSAEAVSDILKYFARRCLGPYD